MLPTRLATLTPLACRHQLQLLRWISSSNSTRGPLPTPPGIAKLISPAENNQARTWVSEFEQHPIPKSEVEFTYSRSSGPGGQNVNKVNTKASLRCPVSAEWIPDWAKDSLKKSPSYVSSADSLLITSSVHRSQAENVQDCLSKLHSLVLSAASACIVNEPSKEQRERVHKFEKAEKAKRRVEKDRRSALKRGRKGDW